MNPIIEDRAAELAELCLCHKVLRLELFGSAVTARFVPGVSDLDFLVVFQAVSEEEYVDAFFGLMEGLERLFGMHVDLVVDSAIRNPYFRESVERNKTLIYAA